MDSIRSIVKKLVESRLHEARVNYSEMDHDDLIKMAQDGDQSAFEELLSQYDNLINKQTRKFFLDGHSDGEDIKQVASIAFWQAVESYNPDIHKHGFGAYANLIISRKLTDMIRKEDADVRKLNNLANSIEDTVASDDEGGSATLGDTIASTDLSPEEQFLGKEGARELMRFMRDKFSERERDVVMRHIKGDKIPKIAEETGMTYKSVENTLMRIKNKLNDYLRSYRESRNIKRTKDIEFSDEEKKVLESVITKVNNEESLRESSRINLAVKYESFTPEQLDVELDRIEDEINEIVRDMKDTDYDNRDDLFDAIEGVRDCLLAMEEYLDDEQYNKYEDLLTELNRAEDIEYEGPQKHRDPYAERGLNRADFY